MQPHCTLALHLMFAGQALPVGVGANGTVAERQPTDERESFSRQAVASRTAESGQMGGCIGRGVPGQGGTAWYYAPSSKWTSAALGLQGTVPLGQTLWPPSGKGMLSHSLLRDFH